MPSSSPQNELQERVLNFESAHLLQDMLGADEARLDQIEERLQIQMGRRDTQVFLRGTEQSIFTGQSLLSELEYLAREQVAIDDNTFEMMLVRQESQAQTAEDSSLARELSANRLLAGQSGSGIAPRTRKQLDFIQSLRRAELVFGLGPAGTGKTFLAMAHGLELLLAGEVERIVLTRPAVEAGEALGFLPGDLNEKILPYLRPLYDAMSELLGTREAGKLIEKNLIEVAPLAYMRGRTLRNALILLDEAQNTTREQMLMFLTRMGENSRLVVTGDPEQIDLRPRRSSGLLEAKRVLKGTKGIEFVQFGSADVVRHALVQRIVSAYAKGREQEEQENKGKL